MTMQFTVLDYMNKNRPKSYSSNQLARNLKTKQRVVSVALLKLWRSNLVEREKSINIRRHYEFKYTMAKRVRH